jgi:prophage regulatory protein
VKASHKVRTERFAQEKLPESFFAKFAATKTMRAQLYEACMNPSKPNEAQPAQSAHGATPEAYDGPVTVTPSRPEKLIRLPRVEDRTGLKKSSIYAGVKARTFPAPVRLGGARAVAWKESEIDRWIAERPTARGQS